MRNPNGYLTPVVETIGPVKDLQMGDGIEFYWEFTLQDMLSAQIVVKSNICNSTFPVTAYLIE